MLYYNEGTYILEHFHTTLIIIKVIRTLKSKINLVSVWLIIFVLLIESDNDVLGNIYLCIYFDFNSKDLKPKWARHCAVDGNQTPIVCVS